MTDPTDPRAIAREHAAARRRGVRRIRRGVTALAVTLFLAVFGGIYVQDGGRARSGAGVRAQEHDDGRRHFRQSDGYE